MTGAPTTRAADATSVVTYSITGGNGAGLFEIDADRPAR